MKDQHRATTLDCSTVLSQVAGLIDNGTACDREPERIARDAIREIADWLDTVQKFDAAVLLRLEAER